MKELDKNEYIKRYSKRYSEFGYSPKTLGWGKSGREEIRFGILSQIGIEDKSSVLDTGCGFGDLYGFLIRKGWKGKYLGIDIVETLLVEAKRQYPNINVQCIDILEEELDSQYDFVVSAGIFNAKLKAQNNLNYIKQMLNKMYDICQIGVAADFFSSYVDFRHSTAFHIEPETIFSIAKKISKRVTLRHDYMPYEFSVYIYKDDTINKNNTFNFLK